ncbi:P110/LppT family adhesin N-terminal domain [Mesomycoplasma flocculare]|uniref:p102/LppT family protein n=1 Tax=Mesomycoplasma flocculare ATCC 27399 TaxID=743971 RepID=A0A0A8E896_MESFC|nr:P110/LppT family adhesin N-terminal domain [Mesomycoplasma flocculare]AJC49832.1 P102/LppT family protein [Mesomycoplasma flocculare ATCC 27399]ENX51295.1 LppT protein [Mesomycoplasma flocculare ATCC 27716]
MKKIKLNHIIFSVIGISAIISLAATIPYVLSVQAENYNLGLKNFEKDLKKAKNLSGLSNFNREEFEKLVTNLKVKPQVAKKLNARDALNLHYDKTYNFDLNHALDFGILHQKYPDLLFKLVLPEDKSKVLIRQNVIKNLGLNVSNLNKTINYTVKLDLDFSKQEKSYKFSPENFTATISLANLDFLKEKTATEIAIAFYNSFYKNLTKVQSSTNALYQTFVDYGGVSFSLNSEPVFNLPPNFEIKPELLGQKLVFSQINDARNEIILNLILYDKTNQKEQSFSLKFVDLPNTNQHYAKKFLEIFQKNYELNSKISKYLAKNNENLASLFSNKANSGLNLSQFSDWFKEKSQNSNNFTTEISKIIPNFEPKKVIFALGGVENTNENSNLLTINLKIDGKLQKFEQIPAGLNLGQDNQYVYNFMFKFDATKAIYSGYFRNALENFDANTAENLDNLNFKIKNGLPVTIFASTIDDKIRHILNKPLELKNITKQVAPLLEFLNFSASKTENLTPKPIKVSTTLFEQAKNAQSPSTTSVLKTEKSQNAGDYLKNLFANLEKTKFPANTVLYLSTFYKDKYTLKLELKTNGITKETLEIPIDNVAENNLAYETLAEKAKMHLFLDWKTNIITKTELAKNGKPVLESISALNNPNFKFKVNPEPSEKSGQKVYFDSEEKGIYLAEGGISLEKTNANNNQPAISLKLEKGRTLFYAFKPTNLSRKPLLQYFLLQADKAGNKFALIIEPELFLTGFNKIGVDFKKKQNGNGQSTNLVLSWKADVGIKKTFNGSYQTGFLFDNKWENLWVKPKNPVDKSHDFLNNPEATIILAASVSEESDKKQYLNLKFFSSEYENGLKPKFQWRKEIESSTSWDLAENLILGTTKSQNQESIDKEKNDVNRKPVGITFKGFALFDRPESDAEYNKIFESFRKEYIGKN